MMPEIFSRYRPRFVRSLVYILQASEYNWRDYLAWYHRTSDFANVEKRKSLVWTAKAKTLFALSWTFIIAWAGGLMAFAGSTGSDVPIVVLAGVVFLLPFYFPYVLLVMNVLVGLAQKPIEAHRIREAKTKLTLHRGVKIAIAGSFGKTSMREILKTVLAEGKRVAAPGGSFNTPLGIASFVSSLKGDEEVLLFELGEYYPGDVRTLCAVVEPRIGVVTGVNEAHLEKFGTLERTTDTIFELADFVEADNLYVNGESEAARARVHDGNILYSRAAAGEWLIENARTGLDGTVFTLVRGDERIDARSQLLGLHQIGPIAAAAVIASHLGLSPEQIESGIAKTKAFEHRLESRVDSDGVVTLDDSYNGNPDGVAAVVDFLAGLKGHRRFYVTPGLVEMGARAEEVHREIGRRLAEAGIEKVVLIRNSMTPFVERGLKDAGYKGEVIWFDDALVAYKALPHLTIKGDIVLLQNDWPDQYA
jgi:UDP-N-acetylmuramoyl-tripeptide--D-alanyl-D-alanine ligase